MKILHEFLLRFYFKIEIDIIYPEHTIWFYNDIMKIYYLFGLKCTKTQKKI